MGVDDAEAGEHHIPEDWWAGESPPKPITAYLACRQRMLLEQFARWVEDGPGTDGVAEVAGRLLERFSEDVLLDLLIVADRMPASDAPLWVRQEFDAALGAFGAALRGHIPKALRHASAQVLQLRMLEAERRMGEALRTWPGSR